MKVDASRVDAIDALLPQTQCTRCGFPTCRAYAEAIANDLAAINQCPPGGAEGVAALAHVLGLEAAPLNPANGVEEAPTIAFIDEDMCIGCTKCIQACPVDAIVGTAKRMHTIIKDECTGCGLCLPPCPVDCIALVPVAVLPLAREQVLARAAHARARFDARTLRLLALAGATNDAKPERDKQDPLETPNDSNTNLTPAEANHTDTPGSITRAAVLEAIARGKARREAQRKDTSSR